MGVVTAHARPQTKLDPASAFGQLLRRHRRERKWSQETLAARSGYERAFISLLELGKTNPSLRSIFDICSALGIRPAQFLRQVEKLSNFELPNESEGHPPDHVSSKVSVPKHL
ncbi:helix-turn-helix domain-containing protein [Edaphobacter sp.]|uniref:helix-turn-helix domain-containing protein n=1 Tax=Edaphobacter sp. TaxID=1934404 RepID=UPI0039C896FD